MLFVSGYPDDPLVQQLVTDRDATLLSKPLHIETLAEHVRRLLDA
ncbi:MAG: hypothetical protein ACOCUS_07385 [Polyangiales bacterium]